ncbi:granzyme B-like isoform X1 [Parambassis ranga]|uniref:trypsin n=2 Tax=Parambassis ranga TaxID=210632 RepID=A0A6P7HCY6_9TELE|nr:granzyme B-like isoform X1 [Parambassis ranga]
MIHLYCIINILMLVSLTGASESSIINGNVSKPHSRPYMASLQIRGWHTCGGILIREDFVLTAAHCKNSSEPITVVLGAHNITKNETSQQRIKVAKYYKHPKYTGKFDYDIMLLKLQKKAALNRYVKSIGLPKKNGEIPANIKCDVAGWGRTGANELVSDVLREAKETMQFSTECKYKWKEYFNSEHMICTRFGKKGKKGGVCQGDSGGPIMCNNKPQGITAFTNLKDCSDTKYPHVFTKINYFLPWIKEKMKQ